VVMKQERTHLKYTRPMAAEYLRSKIHVLIIQWGFTPNNSTLVCPHGKRLGTTVLSVIDNCL
jgi:hypothetical protein